MKNIVRYFTNKFEKTCTDIDDLLKYYSEEWESEEKHIESFMYYPMKSLTQQYKTQQTKKN